VITSESFLVRLFLLRSDEVLYGVGSVHVSNRLNQSGEVVSFDPERKPTTNEACPPAERKVKKRVFMKLHIFLERHRTHSDECVLRDDERIVR
jgi:hypothetical protein